MISTIDLAPSSPSPDPAAMRLLRPNQGEILARLADASSDYTRGSCSPSSRRCHESAPLFELRVTPLSGSSGADLLHEVAASPVLALATLDIMLVLFRAWFQAEHPWLGAPCSFVSCETSRVYKTYQLQSNSFWRAVHLIFRIKNEVLALILTIHFLS